MNRSSKGFGLSGVAIVVVVMFLSAVFSSSASSSEIPTNYEMQKK